MRLVQDPGEAAAVCRRLAESRFVAMDTEFLRDRTYWPVLCLIQMAGDDGAAVALDPVVAPDCIDPFGKLLFDDGVLKVMHGGRQDMEIFYHAFGRLPTRVFDTQVAAMALGYGEQCSYARLAADIAGVAIDKGERFTDWSARPLRESQLLYAQSDVIPLRRIYEKMRDSLAERGREDWIREEMDVLRDPETHALRPEDAWRRLAARKRSPEYMSMLAGIAEWREREAQTRDLPRRHVMSDDLVQELAASPPASFESMQRMRSLPRSLRNQKSAASLLKAVAAARARAPDGAPKPPPPGPHAPEALMTLLKAMLRARCAEHEVAPRLVASADALAEFAAGGGERLLEGWRGEVFGRDADRLRRGDVGIAWRDEGLQPIDARSGEPTGGAIGRGAGGGSGRGGRRGGRGGRGGGGRGLASPRGPRGGCRPARPQRDSNPRCRLERPVS